MTQAQVSTLRLHSYNNNKNDMLSSMGQLRAMTSLPSTQTYFEWQVRTILCATVITASCTSASTLLLAYMPASSNGS